jgi:hypothetical protein
MKVGWHYCLSLLLGICGGILGSYFVPWFRSNYSPSNISARTVRAERFELLDPSKNVVSYWGTDWKNNRILIVFLDERGKLRAEMGVEAMRGFSSGYSPFTALLGSDGGIRIQQILNDSQYPEITMGDAASADRIQFGRWRTSDVSGDDDDQWDKWSLVFRDPSHGWKDYAEIGTSTVLGTDNRTGYFVLRDSNGKALRYFPK